MTSGLTSGSAQFYMSNGLKVTNKKEEVLSWQLYIDYKL